MKSLRREAIEQEPCRCERCLVCGGRGTMIGSMSEGFRDDDECFSCNGVGVIEVCDRCHLLEEMDQDGEQ